MMIQNIFQIDLKKNFYQLNMNKKFIDLKQKVLKWLMQEEKKII